MKTQPATFSRFVRPVTLFVALVVLFALAVQISLAQDKFPSRKPAAASLTVGVSTDPAGGEGFEITAVSSQVALGRPGVGNIAGRFAQPRDVVSDADGNFYVSNHINNRIIKFSPGYRYIRTIGSPGSGDGQLRQPNQLAVHGARLYVPDTNNHRVSIFTTDGAFVRSFGSLGSGNGQFNQPQGVAIDGDGNVYITDTFNHRIQVFSSEGVYLRQWGQLGSSAGQFRFPTHLDFDDAGNLYAMDSNNSRIQVFDKQGTFIRQLGTPGSGPGQLRIPVGLDIAGGYLYIADTFNNRIQKWTLDGQYVAHWATGENGALLDRPNGLLVSGDMVYVTDIHNNRVQVYSQRTFALDDGHEVTAELATGTYDVTQAPAAGWSLANATCDGGNPTTIANGVRVLLGNNISVSCSFDLQSAEAFSRN